VLILWAAGWAASLALLARERRRLVVIARAHHEVRGPLCAARLGLEALAADPARTAAIDLELRRAARALDDLTATAPAEHPELLDLAALARSCEPAWRAVAAAHGAELQVDTPAEPAATAPLPSRPGTSPRGASPAATAASSPAAGRALFAVPAAEPVPTGIFADPLRIAQACANLVANAAEHGGGVVRVRVRAAGDRVRFEVADEGPGLPAPVGALVAAARSRAGRRGHGLAIAAQVAARCGGRLAAAPGARVVIDLPAAVAPLRAVAAPPIVA
jgi:signal transduction histidine kinase